MGNIDFKDQNVQIAGLVIFVSLVIVYVFFFSAMLPFGFKARGEEIARLETEYEKLSADLMKAKQTASRLPQVKAEYEALATKWEEAKTLLPTEKEMAELLSQVTVAGQRSGVDFLNFEPKAPVAREIYLENPIDVKVQGGYHEIGLFLGRMSNLPRIVNVKSIDLKNVTNPDDPEAPDLVEASMSLAAYVLSDAASQAQGAPATPAGKTPPAPAQPKGGRGGH
ncbi:MAG: type 4a pilus biogenesis protein PilO [Gemmatimonadetes bacterium]|nr:type 4a pilus biogenesis protein PilO [Gemmatimonadota bacterium]